VSGVQQAVPLSGSRPEAQQQLLDHVTPTRVLIGGRQERRRDWLGVE